MTWHPVDREVAETEKGSAQAEVLIILGVEGLAPCRHPGDFFMQANKGGCSSEDCLIASVVTKEKTELF